MLYFNWLQSGNPTGSVERYPELSPDGESSVPGLFIAGDLTGIPLLKKAVESGAARVRHLFENGDLSNNIPTEKNIIPLVIVGGGPAGISAAMEATRLGIQFILYESNRPYSSIASFPEKKPIFLEPKALRPESPLRLTGSIKEKLLEELEEQFKKSGISSRMQTVKQINPSGKRLLVETDKEKILAHRVILAIGKSGNYRRLGVSGETLSKVSNRLLDPTTQKGKRVLVVGGGDNAVETALLLAKEGANVNLSFRGADLVRPKQGNIDLLHQFVVLKKIELEPNTNVKEIKKDTVILITGKGSKIIKNDSVYVMIGQELPIPFLKRSGIRIQGEKSVFSWLGLIALLSFFTMLYTLKASSSSTNLLTKAVSLWGKLVLYFQAPFSNIFEHWPGADRLYFFLGWAGGVIFLISGILLILFILFRYPTLFRGGWAKVKYSYFALVAITFFIFQLQHHFSRDMVDWEHGTIFFYTFLYTLTILIFGIRRMIIKPTKYIIRQTTTLILIQTIGLFLFPFYFYDWWIAPHSASPIVQQLFPEGKWSAFGFILFWPLNFWTFGTSTFWTIFPYIQTFVILPLIVWKWGKGAYCGWICSCGAMAETLGDEYRSKAPHGKTAKKMENIGQIALWFATGLVIYQIITGAIGHAESVHLFKQNGFAQTYKFLIDVIFAGVLGLGLYFFYSGRTWCRFGCPLAALMHLYSKFTRYRIISEKSKCISCNICTKSCHMGIDVMNFAVRGKPMDDVQCVRCSDCIVNCPTQVLSFGKK